MIYEFRKAGRRDTMYITSPDLKSALEKFQDKYLYVYDCDNAGSFTTSIIVRNGETLEENYFDITNTYYIEYEPEFWVHNDFTVNERKTKADLTKTVYGFHDWLFV